MKKGVTIKIGPRLCLDMDGVIVDFQRAIAKAFNVPFEWKAPGSMRVEEGLGIPWMDWWKPCNYEFWRDLPKTEDADRIVKLISNYFDVDQICVVTSFPTKWGYPLDKIGECVQGKTDWLRKNFPELTTHFLIGPSKHFCAGRDSYLVDDADSNVNDFIDAGGKGIIVPRIWNSKHNLDTSVEGVISFIQSRIDALA